MLITYCLTRYRNPHTLTHSHSHTLLIFRKKSRCPQTLQQASEATITGLLLISASISFMRKRSSCLPSSADTSQLARVILTSAFISSGPSSIPAPWVETCSCPPGFVGQFCERCAPGFTWDDPGRGPLSACVPCNCHQHGSCHPETGNEQNFYRAFGVCAEFKWCDGSWCRSCLCFVDSCTCRKALKRPE